MTTRRRYAEDTKVPVERTRAELERMMRERGAEGFGFGWDPSGERLEFLWKGLQIRFVLPRAEASTRKALASRAQADRQRWRALYLVVRAKLEAVESGIAVFEQEFLGFIVDPQSNRTVYEHAKLALEAKRFDVSRALPPAAMEGE